MASDPVLAIDIGGTKLAAALVTAAGGLIDQRRSETKAEEGAEQALANALELGRDVAAANGQAQPQAVGLSTNGLTDENGVALAPAVPGWEHLRIPSALRQAFPGAPTAILNDVKAATLAELRWGGLHGIKEGLYVNLGTGVAAGIVSHGELVQGAHGAAGEIAYLAPSLEAASRRQPDQALLEERIGGRGVATWASAELGRATSMQALLAAEASTPEHAVAERLLDEICFWIANLTVVLDPEVVVLGGGIMRTDRGLARRAEAAIARISPFPTPVRRASFGPESSLLGAGAIALEALSA
jgi:glucokinase